MSRELRKSPSAHLCSPGRDYEAIDCPGWLVPHLQMGRLRPERRGIFPGPHIPRTVADGAGPGLLPHPSPTPPGCACEGKGRPRALPTLSLQPHFSPLHPSFSLLLFH